MTKTKRAFYLFLDKVIPKFVCERVKDECRNNREIRCDDCIYNHFMELSKTEQCRKERHRQTALNAPR
jgi:hypothetical protein